MRFYNSPLSACAARHQNRKEYLDCYAAVTKLPHRGCDGTPAGPSARIAGSRNRGGYFPGMAALGRNASLAEARSQVPTKRSGSNSAANPLVGDSPSRYSESRMSASRISSRLLPKFGVQNQFGRGSGDFILVGGNDGIVFVRKLRASEFGELFSLFWRKPPENLRLQE